MKQRQEKNKERTKERTQKQEQDQQTQIRAKGDTHRDTMMTFVL